MRRFNVTKSSMEDGQVTITGEEAKHISLVLRLRAGDLVEVFDGSGTDYKVELTDVAKSRVMGRVVESYNSHAEPPVALVLVQGLAKGEKMDLIIQKAVEIGVSRIIPVNTDHAVVKINREKSADKTERWNRISAEACKQCGRSRPPVVEPAAELAQVLESTQGKPGIFFYEGAEDSGLRGILAKMNDITQDDELFLFIGPEGGFSKAEARKAEESGIAVASLGSRILRTETAAIAALAITMFEIGDLGGCR